MERSCFNKFKRAKPTRAVERFNYPRFVSVSYERSRKRNPFVCYIQDGYEKLCTGIRRKSDSYTNHYKWNRDLRKTFEEIEPKCREIIKRNQGRVKLGYEEAKPLAKLEVLGSLIFYQDHSEVGCTPENYKRVNEDGNLKTPVSRSTRHLVYQIVINFDAGKLRWDFDVNYLEEEQWSWFSREVIKIF